MSRVTLCDQEWLSIYPRLQACQGIYVRKEAGTRRFVEAVLWILRSGAPWRLLPETYGPWNTVYKRFADWSEKGIWARVLQPCTQAPDREWVIPDSTTVRAHPCAAGAPKKKAVKLRKPWGEVEAALAPRSTS
jgi:transposase